MTTIYCQILGTVAGWCIGMLMLPIVREMGWRWIAPLCTIATACIGGVVVLAS